MKTKEVHKPILRIAKSRDIIKLGPAGASTYPSALIIFLGNQAIVLIFDIYHR